MIDLRPPPMRVRPTLPRPRRNVLIALQIALTKDAVQQGAKGQEEDGNYAPYERGATSHSEWSSTPVPFAGGAPGKREGLVVEETFPIRLFPDFEVLVDMVVD